jgi:glutamate N-acetyltransferase/amino-acid N-acetyltransferase
MSVTAPRGFVAAGIAGGIKASGAADLALVAGADGPVWAAGVFTTNLMTAAPVLVTRSHLAASGGHVRGVVINSGNANAATGEQGKKDAEAMCAGVAVGLGVQPQQVLVCSTGLIGIPMPMAIIDAALPGLVAARTPEGGPAAARAIMTTDTVPKEVVVAGDGFTVGGMAKGAGMMAPNMATMLSVITTDAEATAAELKAALTAGVADTFNALDIDGCTSTNDTVLLLASGKAGRVPFDALADAVHEACASLSGQIAADAEGATKVVHFSVVGARDDAEAMVAARYVARGQLVKSSWYGQKAYWGRVASELGSCGVAFDQELLSISYGGVTVCRRGVAVEHDTAAVEAHMAERDLVIEAHLGIGSGRGAVVTTDLTHAYIDENMADS